jgi:heparosan-N-sulfate-glucuronate 5-epimerase
MTRVKFQWTILTLLLFVAIIASVLITNKKGDEWEQAVRTGLYKISQDSIPDYAKETVDDNGIPMVYYPEQNGVTAGRQYNATIVCNYALAYYQSLLKVNQPHVKTKFFNCVRWLEDNMRRKNNYALFVFNWQQPWYLTVRPPFTSGMTSGRAMEVFLCANRIQPSPTYLDNCGLLLNGFYVPIDAGGFTYKSKAGCWYEELADTAMNSPYILDGHIYAILGVHAYWQQTKSDSAAFIFREGIAALKQKLPGYNAPGNWSYYDKYYKPSDKKYHRILTNQMKQLWEITGDDFFKDYYNRWNTPLSQPYVRRVIQERNVSGIILVVLVAMSCIVVLMIVVKILAVFIFRRHYRAGLKNGATSSYE